MGEKMQGHNMVAVRGNGHPSSKRKYPWLTKGFIWKFLALFTLVGLFACKSTYDYFDADNRERRVETLWSMCDERARMLQDQFNVSVNHVHALAVLISTFHYNKHPSAIDQQTFAEYAARTSFERPLLSGVAYAERVKNSERAEFERQNGFTIKTMEGHPSPIKDEYAPVIFTQETLSHIQSLDMMSGEEDHENILRARSTGKAVLTNPFPLLGSHNLGVVLTFPVYKSKLSLNPTADERIAATAGYLGGSFDVESLIKNLLAQLAENQPIVVNVYDVTNSSDPLVMYGTKQNGDRSLVRISKLDFGDPFRKHEMICRYLREAPTPWEALGLTGAELVIWILFALIVYIAGNDIIKVEDDLLKMKELKIRAEAADVAKSQFLATVSHEIRTPMNGILGMLALLLDTELCSTQRDYAQTAQACAKALISLINEVLDRAKIEAGKLELDAVPFNLRSILDDVLSLFCEKSRNKNIELAAYVSDKVPKIVIGDPGRFRQVITNLVGNSVKFTEKGHVFVRVVLVAQAKAAMHAKSGMWHEEEFKGAPHSDDCHYNTLSGHEAADDQNIWDTFKHLIVDEDSQKDCSSNVFKGDGFLQKVSLMVSVEDTGIGIPEPAQNRVFMPFMQADSSTSRTYGGTGIGLSISKCLVELMGGQIDFISHPQIGSTFSFNVDFQRCDTVDVQKSLCEDIPTAFKGLKAIVVDGKPVRASVTKYHLKRLGVIVEVAGSIKAALDLNGRNGTLVSRHEQQADMIFVEKDLWITNEDGSLDVRFLEWKQNGLKLKFPKLILLATDVSTGEFERARAGGFSDTVIKKPLRASMVAACLQQVLNSGKKTQGKVTGNGSSLLGGLLNGKQILVVDDNIVNRRVAAGALKKFGAIVECAESGKAALDLLQIPHNFDACFMDIQMPEMDGFEATCLIRAMESKANDEMNEGCCCNDRIGMRRQCHHLPILAMTADVIHATMEKCMDSGMDGYVSKPFEEENLYKAIVKFFEPEHISNHCKS
ncbi:histidine kinase receptor of two-component system [Lithospermum erythrorhizon]|uniref:histidine kinase n=1 Tax=Lithospermum erythrorhizon TaxID=34254 RepID=A0AAV3P7A5_LITER